MSSNFENEFKNRSDIREHLNRIESMIYVAAVASTHEFFSAQITPDYLRTIHQLTLETIKMNEEKLGALLKKYTPAATNTKRKKPIKFTPREVECAQQIMEGKSPSQVSKKLTITERTVDFYLVNMVKKLTAMTSLHERLSETKPEDVEE